MTDMTTQAALSESNQRLFNAVVPSTEVRGYGAAKVHMLTASMLDRLIDAARAEGHRTGYKEGWSDREGDLIAGVERITGRAEGRPVAEAEKLADILRRMLTEFDNGCSHATTRAEARAILSTPHACASPTCHTQERAYPVADGGTG